MSIGAVRLLWACNHAFHLWTSNKCCGIFFSNKQWVLLLTSIKIYPLPAYVEPTKGGGQFTRFSRALPPAPEERQWWGKGLQRWMFFHLQSTLKVPFSEQNADRYWHGFLWVLVVKQICPHSLTCFLRFTCYYYFILQFLLFLPCETFCFHLPQGYILWSPERIQPAQGGP